MEIRTVMLIDHQSEMRENIRSILELNRSLTVVADVGNGPSALKVAQHYKPDLIILDPAMPHEDGLKFAANLQTELPEAKVLMLSFSDDIRYIRECLRGGACGYVLKDRALEELQAAIEAVFCNQVYVSEPEVDFSVHPPWE